jgi:3-isopropylmalate/(R)-2-methylmalate dehydratase large subunit
MPATLAEKIIARAAGRHKVAPREIVTGSVDLAMGHDGGFVPHLKKETDALGEKRVLSNDQTLKY